VEDLLVVRQRDLVVELVRRTGEDVLGDGRLLVGRTWSVALS
jgi:hypothetical protein